MLARFRRRVRYAGGCSRYGMRRGPRYASAAARASDRGRSRLSGDRVGGRDRGAGSSSSAGIAGRPSSPLPDSPATVKPLRVKSLTMPARERQPFGSRSSVKSLTRLAVKCQGPILTGGHNPTVNRLDAGDTITYYQGIDNEGNG
jgi:hypothetical protein